MSFLTLREVVDSPADGTIYTISIAQSRKQRPGDQRARRELKLPAYIAKAFSGPAVYQKVDIDGNRLVYHVYDGENNVLDELVIEK